MIVHFMHIRCQAQVKAPRKGGVSISKHLIERLI